MVALADLTLPQENHLCGRCERQVAFRVFGFSAAHVNVAATGLANRVNMDIGPLEGAQLLAPHTGFERKLGPVAEELWADIEIITFEFARQHELPLIFAREQLYRGHAIDNAPLGCKPERPSQSRQMAVYRAALIAIIDHSGCELRDQFFVDVIQARLRQGCELQQTSVLAFIELDGLWVIGTAHPNLIQEALFEPRQARNFFALF